MEHFHLQTHTQTPRKMTKENLASAAATVHLISVCLNFDSYLPLSTVEKGSLFCSPNEWDSTVIVCDQFDNSSDTTPRATKAIISH